MPIAATSIDVRPFRNAALMDATIRRHEVWQHIKDDETPDGFSIADAASNPHNLFFSVSKDGEYCGFFAFYHRPELGSYEMHTALHGDCRGRAALTAGWKAVDWVFANTGCSGIFTNVMDDNRPSKIMMAIAKWHRLGRVPHPSTKDGASVVDEIYGLNRADWQNLYFS